LPEPPSRPRFKAVLFDLDGTLIEFKFDVAGSRKAAIEWLARNGFDVKGLSPDTKTLGIFQWVRAQCDKNVGGLKYDFTRSELSKILEVFEYKGFSLAKPHPGSLRTLKRLKSEQVLCGLVTNSGGKPVSSILREFGFLPYLEPVITRDDMENLKPDPEGILKAIRILEVDREDAVYVGDSIIDIEAAKSAAVSCVALSKGMYTRDSLIQKKPDFIIDNIEDVEQIVFQSH
jgi:phosphoglycolate phosphatase-like HAD superfamily hydrolase